MDTIILIIGWLICSIIAYLLRRYTLRKYYTYTIRDREYNIGIAIIFSPIAVFSSILVFIAAFISNDENREEEAKW